MAKTFTNHPALTESEISIGIERLLIADVNQSWTPARVDIATPPTGFSDLGPVVEDTPRVRYSREFYDLKMGYPAVSQFRTVMSMEGSFEVALHSKSWRRLQYAAGNFTASTTMTIHGPVASLVGNVLTVAATTSVQSLVVGRRIAIAATTPALQGLGVFESRVTSISASLLNVYLEHSPDAEFTAAYGFDDAGFIGTYEYVRIVFGSSKIRKFKLLGVIDFIDGTQIVHYFPKVDSAGEFVMEVRPDANTRIPLSFNAYGVPTTISGCSELEVFESFEFVQTSGLC